MFAHQSETCKGLLKVCGTLNNESCLSIINLFFYDFFNIFFISCSFCFSRLCNFLLIFDLILSRHNTHICRCSNGQMPRTQTTKNIILVSLTGNSARKLSITIHVNPTDALLFLKRQSSDKTIEIIRPTQGQQLLFIKEQRN